VIAFYQTMTVYTPHASTGVYSVVAASGIPCRLVLVELAKDDEGARAEMAPRRRLLWKGYAMPDHAQVAIDGTRWNVLEGTAATVSSMGGAEVYRRCEVTAA
jgi:hypothetical protein